MHLTLHLTRSCNMRCRYCYAPPKACEPMSLETARRAIDLGVSASGGSCGVVFFGGEPLLHKDLIRQTIEYGQSLQATDKGRLHYKLTTNGLLLDDEFLEYAAKTGIILAMSFDGVREAHDAHRQLPDGRGTFDILLPRLKRLMEVKPYSSIIMVVNPDTAEHYADSVTFLLDQGVRYIITALNYSGPWDEESFQTLEEQYQKLARLYAKWTRAGRKFYFSPFEVKIASHVHADRCDELRCDLGARQNSVDPEGYLYPCVQFPKAGPESPWCLGNVRDGIDPQAHQRVREIAKRPKEPCNTCALERRCLETCACLNWQTTGSIENVSPVLCRHERMITPIADKLAQSLFEERNALFIQKHYNDCYPLLSLLEDQLSGA